MRPARDDLFQVHRPVMVTEVLRHLLGGRPDPVGGPIVDGTVGPGGHAAAILEADAGVRLLGMDRDGEALAVARERLAPHEARVRLVHASYAEVERVLEECGWGPPRGVLLDLGVSSLQLADPARGFSFQEEGGSADMRFDRAGGGQTALDLVNRLPERRLAEILREHGGEPRARAVARRLVQARPVRDGATLAGVVRRAAARVRRHDPVTRTFQALRIAVNDEMGHLERGLEAVLTVLAPGGRVVVLSFHSGEDRRVKEAFRAASRAGRGTLLTKKPIRPTDAEVRENPRSRAARLRALESRREEHLEAGEEADGA